MKYLIWSCEHWAWWKPGGLGYTTEVTEAGQFEPHQAEEICKHAGFNRGGVPQECMFPAPEEQRT